MPLTRQQVEGFLAYHVVPPLDIARPGHGSPGKNLIRQHEILDKATWNRITITSTGFIILVKRNPLPVCSPFAHFLTGSRSEKMREMKRQCVSSSRFEKYFKIVLTRKYQGEIKVRIPDNLNRTGETYIRNSSHVPPINHRFVPNLGQRSFYLSWRELIEH